MDQKDLTELVDFDDGHSPGATSVTTKMAMYNNKYRTNFFSIYDNLLPSLWCDRAYQYAFERNKPWGMFCMFCMFCMLHT
jgi:hypothetical protein